MTPTHWTRERIEGDLAAMDRDSSEVAAGTLHYRKHVYLRNVVDELLTERDALLAERDRTAAPSTYRLTEKFGGHEVEIADPDVEVDNSSHVSIRIVGEPNSWQVGDWPTEWLVEVRPPSIDDPVAWPYGWLNDIADASIRVHDEAGQVCLSVQVRRDHLTEVGTPFDYVVATIPLDLDRQLDVGRVLWQRANAIESTADGAP